MANFAGNGLEALLAREYNKWTSPQAREAAVPLVLAYIHRTKSVASESIEFIKCLTKIATLIVKEECV